MFEEKDYYMRIVHELVRMLIRLVFNKDIDRDGEEAVPRKLSLWKCWRNIKS